MNEAVRNFLSDFSDIKPQWIFLLLRHLADGRAFFDLYKDLVLSNGVLEIEFFWTLVEAPKSSGEQRTFLQKGRLVSFKEGDLLTFPGPFH